MKKILSWYGAAGMQYNLNGEHSTSPGGLVLCYARTRTRRNIFIPGKHICVLPV